MAGKIFNQQSVRKSRVHRKTRIAPKLPAQDVQYEDGGSAFQLSECCRCVGCDMPPPRTASPTQAQCASCDARLPERELNSLPCVSCSQHCCNHCVINVLASAGDAVYYRVTQLCKLCLFNKEFKALNNDNFPGIQFVCAAWENGAWGPAAVWRQWCVCCRQTVPEKRCADCAEDVCAGCCKRARCKRCRAVRYLHQRGYAIALDQENSAFASYHQSGDTHWSPKAYI